MVYIGLPKALYNWADEQKLKEVFHSNVDKYFEKYDISIYTNTVINTPSVIFMDNPINEKKANDVVDTVVRLFRICFRNDELDVDVKIGYAKFNPTFKPVHEEERKGSEEPKNRTQSEEFDYEKLASNYIATFPRYTFEQVILPKQVLESIENAIGVLSVEKKVFDDWGLRHVIPEIATALNFYGPPGTGKTMCAEAIAHKLGKKIIKATYADVESKYHGEGPKMVKAIFMAAEKEDAILFLDESDSLLSKRLTTVTDGSSQAINSMRSQLLISLESFKGIVIFATNLVVNYDKAFLSRLINIEFVFPTKIEREKIWWNHLRTDKVRVPLASDVDIPSIAEKYEFCGREIKNTVKNVCISVALKGCDVVTQADLVAGCEKTLMEKSTVINANDETVLSAHKTAVIRDVLQNEIKSTGNKQ